MSDTLNTYGYKFQVKVMSAMLTDREYTAQIYDILDPDYFESESLKFIIKSTLAYFREYRKMPTADVYKVQITNLTDDLHRKECIKSIQDVWKELDSSDLQFVKETSLDFCRNQELKKAIIKSVDLLKEGKYDAIKTTIDRAIKAGMSTSLGIDYLKDIDYRYSLEAEPPRVPTGWKVFDDLIGGGLPRGKLAVISMPSGYGKSNFLCHVAGHALKMGFTVFYYTLELDDRYVARRIDANVTGISLDQLSVSMTEIKNRLSKLSGRLFVQEYPTKRASVTTINAHIDKMELLGVKPDLVIIDDPELLRFSDRKELRKDELVQELYEEIRGLGKEKGFATWVPSQSNRTALQQKGIAGSESISSSYGKIFTADLVVFGDRRGKHKVNGTAEFKIEKSRLGPDGMTLPAKMDTAKVFIEMFEPVNEEIEDEDAYKRESLRQKYEAMVNNKRQEPNYDF